MAIDKITTAAITDGTITSSDLAAGAVQNQSAFKNIIINGDISVAQRGTSQSSLSTGFNTVDRFEILKSADSAFTESQSTDVPTGQGFANSWKIECTTADASLNATDYLLWRQPIEAQNLQYLKFGTASAESITLSFWIKSSKTGTYIISLRNADNDRLIAQSYTVSSADTWEKKELTFAGDTSSGFNNDNGEGLRVQFQLLAGSNYSSGTLQTTWGTYAHANSAVGQVNFADSTSNNLYITGVQLEAGTSASDFEFLPVDVNLSRCQRYFELQQTSYFIVSRYNSSNSYGAMAYFKTEKRANPTIAKLNGTTTVAAHGANEGSHSNDEFIGDSITTTGCAAQVTTGSAYLTWFCGLDSPLTFDSEL